MPTAEAKRPPLHPEVAAPPAAGRVDALPAPTPGRPGALAAHPLASASFPDLPQAAHGGVKDVTLPSHPLSRHRTLRAIAASGGVPSLWIPWLNRGTGLSRAARKAARVEGLLPDVVESMDHQAARVIAQLEACASPIDQYSRLQWLAATNVSLVNKRGDEGGGCAPARARARARARSIPARSCALSLPSPPSRPLSLFLPLHSNQTHLFYHVIISHIELCAPIIYTPTVGAACASFSDRYRTPAAGLYLNGTPGGDQRGRFDEIVANWPNHSVAICVVTDGSRVLGLGDLGVGGMGISVGKISLYVAAAGFSPEHAVPATLDTGCGVEAIRTDPFYLGARTERLSDADHLAAFTEFVFALRSRFPDCLVQFEDVATDRAFRVLHALRDRALCFNDDIQGTGAVVAAGILNGMAAQGTPLADARVIFFGAGSSAVGVAATIAAAFAAQTGEDPASVRSRVWMVDSKGLIHAGRPGGLAALPEHKRLWARPDGEAFGGDRGDLVSIIRTVRPHALVGLSATGGAWGEAVVKALCECTPPPASTASGGPGPLIFPLSNPTSAAEVTAADAIAWSGGGCLFASGSPFPPVVHPATGAPLRIGQANNVFVFPGIGFGAVMAKARMVSDGMLMAATRACAACVSPEELKAGALYPRLSDLRAVSLEVAAAVATAAWEEGLAGADRPADVKAYLRARQWSPTDDDDTEDEGEDEGVGNGAD